MRLFMKNRVIIRIISMLLIVGLCFGLASCTESETEDLIANVEINSDGELIVFFKDGSVYNAGRVESNQTNITVEGQSGDVSAATTKGLMSAVSIESHFVSRSSGFFPSFGIIGGSGNNYYSCGSGVIYRLVGDEALIITNHHVVYDSGSNAPDGISDDIDIYLYGKEDDKYAIKAEYVGGSAYYDLAVLYAKSDEFKSGTVCAAQFSDSEVSVGETAIAVGNPQGYGISATVGIVSVNSEHISVANDGTLTRVVRMDTAVNAGNSGGGLFDDHGRLIGIVNAKIVDEEVENIAYAIPSAVVEAFVYNIIRNCLNTDETALRRVMMGVTLVSGGKTTEIGGDGNMNIVETVAIGLVEEGSIADGILYKGDIILEVSIGDRSVKITRTHHLVDFMLYAGEGDTVTMKIKRDGEIMTVNVEVTGNAVKNY